MQRHTRDMKPKFPHLPWFGHRVITGHKPAEPVDGSTNLAKRFVSHLPLKVRARAQGAGMPAPPVSVPAGEAPAAQPTGPSLQARTSPVPPATRPPSPEGAAMPFPSTPPGRMSPPLSPAEEAIIGGLSSDLSTRHQFQRAIQEHGPEDRLDFLKLLNALHGSGASDPKDLLNILPALAKLPPDERPAFWQHILSLELLSPSDGPQHAADSMAAIGMLASIPSQERGHAGQVAQQIARRQPGAYASNVRRALEEVGRLPSAIEKNQLEWCWRTLYGAWNNVEPDAIKAMVDMGAEKAVQTVVRLQQHYSCLLPTVRATDVLNELKDVEEGDDHWRGALVGQQCIPGPDQYKTAEQCYSNLVGLNRCGQSARSLVDSILRNRESLSPQEVSQSIDTFVKLKASLVTDGSPVAETKRRLSAIENGVANLALSPRMSQELMHWLLQLKPEDLNRVLAGMDQKAPRADSIPPDVDMAISQSAARIAIPDLAGGVEDRVENWRRLLDGMLAAKEVQEPWNAMPLRFLLHFREYVSQKLAQAHPFVSRKALDLSRPEHQLVDYYSSVQEAHCSKFLSLEKNTRFNFEDARKIQGNQGVRQHVLEAAARLDAFESMCLAYEAKKFQERIYLPAIQKTTELSEKLDKKVPLILVGNSTSGGTALTPLGLDKLRAAGTEVFIIKQPSTDTELHSLDPEGLDRDFLQALYQEHAAPPVVIITDLSAHDRYPQAFRRWRNLAAAMNNAWQRDNYEAWRKNGLDDTPFEPDPLRHAGVLAQLQDLASRGSRPDKGLELHFASVNQEALSTRWGERPAPFSWDRVHGPAFICCQTAFSHEDLVKEAAHGDALAARIVELADDLGVEHEKGFVDDKNDYQDPEGYPGKSGRLKFNPLVHPPSRGYFKAMQKGGPSELRVPAPGSAG
ncbi:hypothetical protein M8A51_12925 [Schlegelella sp. S2-27]|uniref:Uncharacterized protein n=1 Tax=Caldimonas mangrovi TaxID=2944811 RepID=A0ABT0YQM6_9BURK|nr:hypothetical protein [Caldimonas mangrovi]MCM5680431.1 hypothetical protein [Caldimonas mangrovi]